MNGFNINCKDCKRCFQFKSRIQMHYVCMMTGEHIRDVDQNIDCLWFVKRRRNHV